MTEPTKVSSYLIAGSVMLAVGLGFVVSRNLHRERDEAPTPAAKVDSEAAPKVLRYKVPVSDMQPQRGPADAPVTMVIWSDLRGAAVHAMEPAFEQVMQEYEGRLRWVHRAVPNSSRPDEARLIHQFGRAVFEAPDGNSKFWTVRKSLLALPDTTEIGAEQLRTVAKEVGADYDKLAAGFKDNQLTSTLVFDMNMGTRFGVSFVPYAFVNGRPVGAIESPEQLKNRLKQLIDEELSNAQRALASGTSKSELYDTLVKDGLWSLDDDPANRKVASKPVMPRFSSSGSIAKP